MRAQSSEISGALKDLFHLPPIASGILIAIVVGLVTLGGIKRIGKVTSLLVPFMSIFYILAGIVLILMRISDIPSVFGQIFKGAFSLKSVGGGLFGYTIMMAMKQGFARGVFSNEAGLGLAPLRLHTRLLRLKSHASRQSGVYLKCLLTRLSSAASLLLPCCFPAS